MRLRMAAIATASILLLSSVAVAADKPAPAPAPAAAAPATKTEKITFTNKIIDGKKTWLPNEAKVKAGDEVEITLINTLADPHGFIAPGLTEAIVVGGNETKVVKIHPKAAGAFKFSCQLHPAHVGGTIDVL